LPSFIKKWLKHPLICFIDGVKVGYPNLETDKVQYTILLSFKDNEMTFPHPQGHFNIAQ